MNRLHIKASLVLLTLAMSLFYSCSGKAKQEEQKEDHIHTLLTQVRELSRLELATTQLKTKLTLDPKDDGFFGWKKMFGTRATEVQLLSQASVYCDFSLLTDSMLHSVNDSFVELTLPPLEVKKEFESMHRTVTKEASTMRTPLSANELNEILESKKEFISDLEDKALEKARPELYRQAEHSAASKLAALFLDLGLGMHIKLNPNDAALIEGKNKTSLKK